MSYVIAAAWTLKLMLWTPLLSILGCIATVLDNGTGRAYTTYSVSVEI